MKRIRTIAVLALALAASGVASAGARTSAAAHVAATPVPCHYIGSGKHDCFFYVAGDGIHGGTPVLSGAGRRVGYLNYGTSWVVCQELGREQASGANHNHWWAWTKANDLKDGWVNALYAHGGTNDGQFGGVPGCHGRHGAPPHTVVPRPHVTTYVALGDSYSSGVGTKDYDLSSHCKRSSLSYPPLVAAHEGWRLLSFPACSGAKTSDVMAHQISAINLHPDIVTISVGGDDANFAGVVKNCLLYRWRCASSIHSAESFMRSKLPLALDTVYSAIQSRDPHAKVFVVGYARLFKGTCQQSLSPFGADQKRLDGAADLIDQVIGHEASVYGFTFVDPRYAFDNHSVCGHPAWLNSASIAHQTETYHPNDLGYRAYAQLVEFAQ